MYCPECGKKIPDEAVFCPECGAKISRAAAARNESRPAREESARPAGGGGAAKIIVAAVAVAVVFLLGRPFFAGMIGSGKDDEEISAVRPQSGNTAQSRPSGSASQSNTQGGNSTDNWILNGNTSSSAGKTEASAAPSARPEEHPLTQKTEEQPVTQNPPAPAVQTPEPLGHGSWEEGQMPQSLDYLTATVFDDFIYPERLRARGLPEDCERMALYEAKGAWKYELIFEETGFKEIGACMIDFGQYAVLFDLYPSQYVFDNEVYYTSREEMGYTTYSGTMDDDIFSFQTADKGSTAVLGSFARIEGTEFGFGSIVGYNGDIVDVLLTRP